MLGGAEASPHLGGREPGLRGVTPLTRPEARRLSTMMGLQSLELHHILQHLTAGLQSPLLQVRTHTGGAQIENVSWNNLDFHHFPHNGDSFN